uniref:ABC1 atypical kinase-like domain-containing protein n=1 Tax=Lutzomyia longipalpis TaxID=7200 RepID=A0A1B0CW01_LUTLO
MFTRSFVRMFSSVKSSHVTKSSIKSKIFVGLVGSGLAYDGFVNEFGTTQAVTRFLRSLRIAVSISLDYTFSLWGLEEGTEAYSAKKKEVHLRCANRMLKGCLANGGLYIKVGQGFATVNHILPPEYTETLQKLHNECLTRKKDEVRKVFQEEFGKSPEDLYKDFNYTPIAAASLAQVFKATTCDGKNVAVKVQYIDLQKRFSGDLGTIIFLQDIIEIVHKNYNFGWIIKDIRKNLERELDFENEARNSERCAKDLKKFSYVYIPKVRWDLTSTRVLTTEFIDGIKMNQTDEIKKKGFDLADIDVKIFTTFSEQIFNTGFVHGDPHPGNVLIRHGKCGKAELVLLDHGLYETIPHNVRDSLCHFWEAIVLKDHKTMKKYATKLNVKDHYRFAEILLQRPLETKGKFTTRLTDEEIAYMQKIARQRFDLIMETLKEMPRNLIFIVRNLNIIRAVARDHGDPVNRPKLMARHAVKCIHREQGILATVLTFVRRVRFEFALLQMSFHYWFITTYLALLTKLGRAPETKSLFQINTKNRA